MKKKIYIIAAMLLILVGGGVNSLAQAYCSPTISNSGVEISFIQFYPGTPSVVTYSTGNNGYSTTIGSSSGNLHQYNPCSIFMGARNTTGSSRQIHLKGFADWNNDGDFDDLLENFATWDYVLPPLSNTTSGGTIFPELASIPGNIRLRFVLTSGASTPTACGTAEEVEDYYMVVLPNVAPVLNTSLTNTLSPIKSSDINNEGFFINELVDMSEPTAHLITDADDYGTTFTNTTPRGIAIYNQTATNGTWQFKVGAGTWTDFGAISTSNALHLLADAGYSSYQNKTKIRFVPTGVGTPNFDFYAWDGTNGLNYNGTFHSIGSTGGANSYSTATTTASLPVLSAGNFDGSKMFFVSDNTDQRLFYSDVISTSGTVNEPNTLLSGNVAYQGYDIAIDSINSKIYWTDGNWNNVSYCNLDGTGVNHIVNADANGLTGVAIGGSKIYYAGYSGIQSANLDGTGKTAVAFNISDMQDIGEIEYYNSKLYFVYQTNTSPKYKIIECNADGSNRIILDSTTNFIKGLHVVNGIVYWTENNSTTHYAYLYKKSASLGSGGSPTLVANEANTAYNDVFVDPGNGYIYVLDYDPVFSSGHTGLKRMSLTGTGITRLGYYEQNIYSLALNNSVPVTALTAGSLTGFGNICSNTSAGPNSFTITGTALTTADITVGALAGFTYATTAGGAYSSSLSLTQSGGSYSQTIYVKFNPIVAQSYNGNIAIGGGGASSINVAVTGTGIICAPTVTTQAVSSIAYTSTTGNGNIIATNGANATVRGAIIYPYTNTDKIIGDAGTTNVSASGDFGTGAFTASFTSLSINTQYNVRAYATSPNGTGYGARVSFYTLANDPSAPTVNGAAATTLDVAINANSNPAGTEFAIQETGGSGRYVQTNGTLGVDGGAPVWQTEAAWEVNAGSTAKTVTGLTPNTNYTFKVKARNGDLTGTGFSGTTSLRTLANIPSAPTVNGAAVSTLNVAINANSNPAGTEFAIQETGGSGRYVQTNGTLGVDGGAAVWQTKAAWEVDAGSTAKTVTGLSVNVNYTFQVKARDADLTPTAFGATAAKYTLANVPSAPTVNAPTVSTLNVAINGNSNPAGTEYAIQETGSSNYVLANGTLGAGPIWQTEAAWEVNAGSTAKTVTGLTANTSYTFKVIARNGELTLTAFSGTTALSTLCSEPGNDVTLANYSNQTTTAFDITWTDGTSDAYLIKIATGDYTNIIDPIDGVAESDGLLVKNVSLGNETVTFSGLAAGTTYYIRIYPYNCSGATVNYKTNSPAQVICSTLVAYPTIQASNLYFSGVSRTGMNFGWINGDGTKRLAMAKLSAISATPLVDGQTYAANSIYGSGDPIDGGYCIYNGVGSSVSVSGLTKYKLYYFRVFEFKEQTPGATLYLQTTNSTNPSSRWTLRKDGDEPAVNPNPAFSIYPNPTVDLINYDFELSESVNVTSELYTSDGRMVKSVNHGLLLAGEQKLSIGVNDLPNGVYMLQIRMGAEMMLGIVEIVK